MTKTVSPTAHTVKTRLLGVVGEIQGLRRGG